MHRPARKRWPRSSPAAIRTQRQAAQVRLPAHQRVGQSAPRTPGPAARAATTRCARLPAGRAARKRRGLLQGARQPVHREAGQAEDVEDVPDARTQAHGSMPLASAPGGAFANGAITMANRGG